MWPRQILDLGKQFNLMMRLQNVLKVSWQGVLKMSWRRLEDFLKMSWRSFGKASLKTSPKRLEDVLKMPSFQDVLKTSSEDEWLRQIYSSWWRRLEDVFWINFQKKILLCDNLALISDISCCFGCYKLMVPMFTHIFHSFFRKLHYSST